MEEAHRAKAAALRDDDNVFDVAYEQQGGEGQDVLSATDIKVSPPQSSDGFIEFQLAAALQSVGTLLNCFILHVCCIQVRRSAIGGSGEEGSFLVLQRASLMV